jgi:hypothetical protein
MTNQAALPPYVLATPIFRFRALAALAGRAALGGPREVALATYLVARLAHDCSPALALPANIRASRSIGARSWLSSLALPTTVRASLARLAEATDGDAVAVVPALRAVISATATYLDSGARLELERLARALAG